MTKIKYIIIFTLVLALGMVYIQLADYQKITSSLLENNSDNKSKSIELENKIIFLETQNQELKDTITSLTNTLELTKIQNDNNQSINIPMDSQVINNDNYESTPEINLNPNINFNNENDITGFGRENTQEF